MRPNIPLITSHDTGRHFGCYGIEQAFCQSPISSPSRASFMTGRYPSTTRLNRNRQCLPVGEKLASRLFADAGYLCGHAGKMHLAPASPTVTRWCEPRIDDGELYDLERDPGEHRNLWREAEAGAARSRMLALLCDRMAETIDPLPPCLAGC